MANKKIKLRKRNGTAFQDMFPEVAATNLLTEGYGTLSDFTQELLVKANPGEESYVSADADGGLNLRNATDVIDDFGMVAIEHNETQADVFACYTVVNGIYTYNANRWAGDADFVPGNQTKCETPACSNPAYTDRDTCVLNGATWWEGGDWINLSSALGNKADLDGSDKVLRTQLPPGIDVEAMQFIGGTGELGASDSTPTALSALFSHLNNLSTDDLDLKVGDYKIVSATTNFWISSSPGQSPNTNDQYLWLLSTQYIDDGDDTETPIIQVENGDRIVFSSYSGSTPGSYTMYFTVINSNYKEATDLKRGIVGLSTQTSMASFSNDATLRHEKVVDESTMRSAMRDQRKIVEFTGNTVGTITNYASDENDLGNVLAGAGSIALVGTGVTKDIYAVVAGNWADSGVNATFPSGDAALSTSNGYDKVMYYDAGQGDYLYVSNSRVLTDEANTSTSTKLPVDGDLIFWVSP